MTRELLDGARKLARYNVVAALVGLSVLSLACYPGGITDVSQTDLVGTAYDRNVFPNHPFQVAVVLDTVMHIVDPDNPQDTLPISRDFDEMIINLVKTNVGNLGYTLIDQDDVNDTNLPDVVFEIYAIASENWVAWQSYPWYGWWGWWGWWPGWGPGWGPGYPCCTTVTNYTTGSLFIDMVDLEGSGNNDIVIPWSAGINGLLSGSSTSTQARLNTNINQAFTQSQYLQVQ